MYLARFSYTFLPADREQAIDLIRQEVAAVAKQGRQAKLLVPLTRAQDGAALQFEVELDNLDQFEAVRQRSETPDWMRAFSDILTCPPAVELLRVA
jgi:hypothetical protein